MKDIIAGIPTMYILAIRFCGAALILLPVCAGKIKKSDRGYILGGALMGASLIIAYALQTYGLAHTTPGKNAFLTATYCVIVPFLHWWFFKKRPDKFVIIAAFLGVAGIGFISLDAGFGVGKGDALSIMCGLFFAVHMVITARFIYGRDPAVLAMTQFAAAGAVAIICALLLEPAPTGVSAADVWTMIFLTVVCTAGCLLLQIFGQKYTPPSQAAVIMTLEAVFGALFSAVFAGETFSARLLAGFALTFAAIIISETKLGFLHKKTKKGKFGI